MIREQVKSAEEPPTPLVDDDSVAGVAGTFAGPAGTAADLSYATSELHRLVDVPEGWPQWSLARRALKRSFDIALSTLALALSTLALALSALTLARGVDRRISRGRVGGRRAARGSGGRRGIGCHRVRGRAARAVVAARYPKR